MKKILLIASSIATCFLISCGSNTTGGGMSDTEKKNLETAQAIAKMFEGSDYSKIGDYIAADAVDHAGMKGDVKGLDSIKAMFEQMSTMSSNMKNEAVKEIASGDYVFQWMKESFTMKVDDPMMGKAGTPHTINAIEVARFKDGKVAEHWGFVDWADVMKMMGGMMQQSGAMNNMNMPPPKKDTAAGKMDKK